MLLSLLNRGQLFLPTVNVRTNHPYEGYRGRSRFLLLHAVRAMSYLLSPRSGVCIQSQFSFRVCTQCAFYAGEHCALKCTCACLYIYLYISYTIKRRVYVFICLFVCTFALFSVLLTNHLTQALEIRIDYCCSWCILYHWLVFIRSCQSLHLEL